MSAYISVDFAKLSTVSAQATALGRRMHDTKYELIALQQQLRETQNYLEKHYETCWDSVVPIKRLRKQTEKINSVVSVLSTTDTLAKDVEKKLKAPVNALKLLVATSSFVFTTAMSVIAGNLTGETDCGSGWCGVGSWSPSTVSDMTASILNSADEDLPSVGADRIQYESQGGQINCLWLARQKMCKIVGDDELFSDEKLGIKAANWEKYEETGINGFSVDYRTVPSKTKMSDIVDTLANDQPCSVMFYMNGHTFTVDRIQDGMVYWTDNFTPIGKQPYFKTGISTTEFTGSDYPGSYTGLMTTATLDAFATWYDKYSGAPKSYVVLKKM